MIIEIALGVVVGVVLLALLPWIVGIVLAIAALAALVVFWRQVLGFAGSLALIFGVVATAFILQDVLVRWAKRRTADGVNSGLARWLLAKAGETD